MTKNQSARIITIVLQHAHNLAGLLTSRRAASAAAHYTVLDLASIDSQTEAHLDGLRIAGEEGWKLCAEQLASNEPGELFAAGVVACESSNPALMARVLSSKCPH